ncbi:DUF4389 domain-containing protein [Kineosporia sp. R_H_3]|uniref:DUF4389 domain-containing protein n=1 Tax=Kineosporia sp. R_H_3 TaxID=1961848 RepID=UPI000B4AEDB5|nr:DUF4389 domain-containing protein [Kineosporia sp. R_H_3]
MSSAPAYPVTVDAALDPHLSRWLWLVKWILLVPHYICLAFLWVAFCVMTVVAFFSILFTGRYPRAVFDFNVGVMRWGWRVAYYGSGALGTDRYPPFTLADVPDYPARFDVAYPPRLSRGLVLVKWWLLAIPHYVVVGLLVGGGAWVASSERDDAWRWGSGGLVGILVLVAGVVLLVRGSYPEPLFDIVLGLDRWVLRVAAYSALMTDVYPPFRLDLGGTDPGTAGRGAEPAPPAPAGRPLAGGDWGAGRVGLVVAGSLLALLSTGPLLTGAALGAADRFARDGDYLTSGDATFATAGSAVTTDSVLLEGSGADWALSHMLGTVRVRVTPQDPADRVFVGIAPTQDVTRYLTGSSYATVRTIRGDQVTYAEHVGDGTPAAPAAQTFWVASATGAGRRSLAWDVSRGDWTIVVLNADSSPGVDVRADVAATFPALGAAALGLIVLGLVGLAAGVVLLAVGVRGTGRPAGPGAAGPPSARVPTLSG